LRGSTSNILDDIERAIDDGVHVYRSLLRNPEFVPGAGATEIVLFFLFRSLARNLRLKPRN